jgi:acyl dehydratase
MSSFEKIQAGDNVPQFERVIDTEQLVRYAGASGDFSRQHWDHEYMVNQGFPGVIVHGWLTFAIMCEAVARWIPPEVATVTDFTVRYHRPHFPGPIRCGGRVVSTTDDESGRHASLTLWARDGDGMDTATASVTLTFG